MAIERQRELRRRRCRRSKVRALRARLAKATDKGERQRLLAKLQRISLVPVVEAKAAPRRGAARS